MYMYIDIHNVIFVISKITVKVIKKDVILPHVESIRVSLNGPWSSGKALPSLSCQLTSLSIRLSSVALQLLNAVPKTLNK